MYLLPITCLVLSSLINGLSTPARFIGHRGSTILTAALLTICFLASLTIYIEVIVYGCPHTIEGIGPWFSVGTMDVSWNMNIDSLSAQMYITVTGVSLAVHIYAMVYMRNDPCLNLFYSYLSMFTGFMLVLFLAEDFMVMLVGWEGIGICSYLLISYHTHRLAAAKSATKAIVVNRLSDGLLLWAILSIWWSVGSLEYDLVGFTNTGQIPLLTALGLLIGAMGKSAQILFHVWLADSMEGPTPVSALIHAATLVTAGVYLMVRTATLHSESIILVGSLTSLMAGLYGLYQSDIKRVIAYSTCSQLGYMLVAIGLGDFGAEASMGHLMTHASFKAAIFLAAGMVITSGSGNKHLARYGLFGGALTNFSTYTLLLVCSLCLVGWPETSGFYSKESILNLAYLSGNVLSDYGHTLLLLSVLVTSLYSSKLFLLCFFLDYSGYNSYSATIPSHKNILILFAFTILFTDVVLKVWLGTTTINLILFFTPWSVKTLPFGLVLGGMFSAASFVGAQERLSSPLSLVWVRFSGTRWGFDQMFAQSLAFFTFDLGRITWFIGDKGLFSVNELKSCFASLSRGKTCTLWLHQCRSDTGAYQSDIE